MTALTGAMRVLAGVAAALVLSAPAVAQLIEPVTPTQIAASLKANGFAAELVQPAEGRNPTSIRSKAGKVDFSVNFDVCREDGTRCQMMVFSAEFKFDDDEARPSKADLNRWNLQEFGKAVADGQGDPWLDLEINTVGGISTTNLTDTLKWWKTLVMKFGDHIGWESLG